MVCTLIYCLVSPIHEVTDHGTLLSKVIIARVPDHLKRKDMNLQELSVFRSPMGERLQIYWTKAFFCFSLVRHQNLDHEKFAICSEEIFLKSMI